MDKLIKLIMDTHPSGDEWLGDAIREIGLTDDVLAIVKRMYSKETEIGKMAMEVDGGQ